MEHLNFIARARSLFAAKLLQCSCLEIDSVGNCVYAAGPSVDGLLTVRTADPSTYEKMPAIGVIVEKPTSTTCKVHWLGQLSISGQTPGKVLFVGDSGALASSIPVPGLGESRYIQHMGVALDTASVLLNPNFHLTRTRG